MDLRIADLGAQSEPMREQAAVLLVEGFDEPRGWPTIELAREEVALVLREGFARAAVEGATLLGWIGGLPEYAGRVWELHPMVVQRGYRRRGVGRALVEAFEAEARRRGALTATLGTATHSSSIESWATLSPGSCQTRMAADAPTSTCPSACAQVLRSIDP